MECHMMETRRNLNLEKFHSCQCDMAAWRLRMGSQRLTYPNLGSTGKKSMRLLSWRTFSTPLGLEEESSSPQLEDYSSNDKVAPKASPEELLEKPLSNDELKALLSDSERAKLIEKLSGANQHNRFLKRQLHIKEDALVNFQYELAVMELEIQALVGLAEVITKSGIAEGSRKINGKYNQSHLVSRLKAVHEKFKEQIKEVDAQNLRKCPYSGVAWLRAYK